MSKSDFNRYGIDSIPFSAKGSYFAVSKNLQTGKIYIRDLHGGDEADSNLYEITVKDYPWEKLICKRSETVLLFHSAKNVDLYFKILCTADDCLFIKTHGLSVVLNGVPGKYNTLVSVSRTEYEHQFYKKQLKVFISVLEGACTAKGKWTVQGTADTTLCINKYAAACNSCVLLHSSSVSTAVRRVDTFDSAEKQIKAEYAEWEKRFPCRMHEYKQSNSLACYIIWNNFVHAQGFLTHDAVYMSKNNMYNIWSWDNCFTALALSNCQPETAYNQLKIFFDNQDAFGAYPDYVNDAFTSFNCLKPPIHAWTYKKMMAENPIFSEKKYFEPAYISFCRSAEYWLRFRRTAGSLFPLYYHGNDSGWDNASVFHTGVPIESPDLCAFLIQKMDILSEFAQKLGKTTESIYWKNRSDDMFAGFMQHFYAHGKFHAWKVHPAKQISTGDSLLLYLPLVIAYRIDKDIRENLVCNLEKKFETPFGIATEQRESGFYKKDGYWLGPIWAPVTYIFIDALRENGFTAVAHRLAEKFFKLTQTGLMSENYDAFTGKGYDDPAFTWSACVFLLLQKEYC